MSRIGRSPERIARRSWLRFGFHRTDETYRTYRSRFARVAGAYIGSCFSETASDWQGLRIRHLFGLVPSQC
jgi:hypothetical protein